MYRRISVHLVGKPKDLYSSVTALMILGGLHRTNVVRLKDCPGTYSSHIMHILVEFYKCLFELKLNVPINSYGHGGKMAPFYGTLMDVIPRDIQKVPLK